MLNNNDIKLRRLYKFIRNVANISIISSFHVEYTRKTKHMGQSELIKRKSGAEILNEQWTSDYW